MTCSRWPRAGGSQGESGPSDSPPWRPPSSPVAMAVVVLPSKPLTGMGPVMSGTGATGAVMRRT
eukprot:4941650-Alexandrium_andersonii.AAC.1